MQEKYFSSYSLKLGIAQGGGDSCHRYLWRRLQGVPGVPGHVREQLVSALLPRQM